MMLVQIEVAALIALKGLAAVQELMERIRAALAARQETIEIDDLGKRFSEVNDEIQNTP